MNVLTLGLLIAIGIIFWILQKSVLNLLTIFCFFWTLIVTLASLRLFDMMSYSDQPFIIVIIGALCTMIGYCIHFIVHMQQDNLGNALSSEEQSYDVKYNEAAIRIISIICIVFYTYELFRVIQLLRAGTSYYIVRRMYQGYDDASFFTSSLEGYISSYVAVPAAYILSSYIIISLFKKKKNHLSFNLAIIGELFYLIVSGSRFILIQFLLGAVYLFFFLGNRLSRKQKKWIVRVTVLVIASTFLLSSLRENRVNGHTDSWGTLRSLYSYFSVSVPLLDHWSQYVDQIGVRTYGLAFFRVPLSILSLLVLHPMHIDIPALTQTIGYINLTDTFVQVFPGHTYNAFATMFYYFYLDFGYLGVCTGSLAWGWMCAKYYRLSRIEASDKNLAFLLLIIQVMYKTMVRWEFTSPSFFVAFFASYLLFRKSKSENNSEITFRRL